MPNSAVILAELICQVNDLFPLHSLAPSFVMPTADGKAVTLDSVLKDRKGVLLRITFAEIGACMLEVPALKRLHSRLKDKGLAILPANIVDSRAVAQKVIGKYRICYPVALDNKAGAGTEEVSLRYNVINRRSEHPHRPRQEDRQGRSRPQREILALRVGAHGYCFGRSLACLWNNKQANR